MTGYRNTPPHQRTTTPRPSRGREFVVGSVEGNRPVLRCTRDVPLFTGRTVPTPTIDAFLVIHRAGLNSPAGSNQALYLRLFSDLCARIHAGSLTCSRAASLTLEQTGAGRDWLDRVERIGRAGR